METIISILSRLPLRVLYAFGQGLVYPLLFYVVRYRRRMVQRNLRYAFPEKSDAEIRALEKAFYHHLADTIAEIIYGYRISDQEIRERMVYQNQDELEAMLRKHHGGICMLGHLGCWEWFSDVARRIEPAIHTNVVYLKLDNPSADRAFLHLRQKRGCTPIEMHKLLREMVRLRKDPTPQLYGLIADQKPSWRSLQFWTDFFGHSTPFLTGSEQLARKFGYPVFFAHITRTARGYYHIVFELIAQDSAATEEGFITRRYAELLEQNIRKQPEIWLWSHNRFKWNKDL